MKEPPTAPAPCESREFLAYLRAGDDTKELADQLRWVLARRETLAHLERRRAS